MPAEPLGWKERAIALAVGVGDAIGHFLIHLLRRIGQTDSSVAPIADYLGSSGVGLFTGFNGTMRQWDFDETPDDLRLQLSGDGHGFLYL